MPSLKLMGRRWGFGADDLVIPSLICCFLRILWFVLLLFILIKFIDENKTCKNDDENALNDLNKLILELFIVSSIVIYIVVIIIYILIFAVACRGTIIQADKRKYMNCLIISIHICIIGELLNAIIGTFIIADRISFPTDILTPCVPSDSTFSTFYFFDGIFGKNEFYYHQSQSINANIKEGSDIETHHSNNEDINFMENKIVPLDEISEANFLIKRSDEGFLWLCLVVVGAWLDILLTFGCWGFACFFSTKLGSDFYDEEQGIAIPLLSNVAFNPLESAATVWAGRCQTFCTWLQCATCDLCGIARITGGPAAFQEVAIVMASFFKGLDLVPSDIVAALFLLRAQQREDEAAAVRAIIRQRIAQEQPLRSRERRQLPSNGMFVSVSRWMWASSGVGARAQSKMHAQQARESRLARGTSGDLDPEASKLLENASYLCPYMLSIYGWIIYSYMHNIKRCCGSCAYSRNPCGSGLSCCCCCTNDSQTQNDEKRPSIIGDSLSENEFCMDFIKLNCEMRKAKHHTDIVYASFTSYSGKAVPYCISVDHSKRKVVISVQGSLSLANAITDALMIPESLQRHAEKWGFQNDAPEGSYAHAGMLRVAAWIREDIERHQVLHRLLGVKSSPIIARTSATSSTAFATFPKSMNCGFSRPFSGKPTLEVVLEEDEEEEDDDSGHGSVAKNLSPLFSSNSFNREGIIGIPSIGSSNDDYNYDVANGSYPENRTFSKDFNTLPECSTYDLELVGHSLGAGIACILSLFLRPQFPALKCTAFSPPGCIFDWKLANHSSEWINSIFVGKDFAARISWFSLVKIRGQILDVLRRAKVNKLKALVAGVVPLDVDDLLYHENEVPDTPQTRALMQRIDELATTTIGRSSTTLDQVRMYIPGRVLHLVKVETTTWGGCGPCRREKYRYVPFWVDDRSTLDEILLSSRMALDHFPDFVDHVIHDIVKEYKLKREE